MCNICRFYRLRELNIWKRVSMGAWDVFITRRVEVVAVAGLPWFSLCGLGGTEFFVFNLGI